MAEAGDREEQLQALYRLRTNVVEKSDAEDRGTRVIVAAVDSLIEDYGGTPPAEGRSNHRGGREA